MLTDAMRAFLGRAGLPLIVAIMIGLAVVAIDHRGYQRAKEEERLRELERDQITTAIVSAIDAKLDARLAAIGRQLAGKIDTIDTEGKTSAQIITRELIRDPGLADPGRCLSPGLLEAVNAARGYPGTAAGAEAGSRGAQRVSGSGARH